MNHFKGVKPHAIAQFVPKLTKKSLGKRGLAQGNLVLNWPEIVGPRLAQLCQPERLTYKKGNQNTGTLRLRVAQTVAPELQHDAPRIIERINSYLGYKAVANLQLFQAPFKIANHPPTKKLHHSPKFNELTELKTKLAHIYDPDLRETLRRLGTEILSDSANPLKL